MKNFILKFKIIITNILRVITSFLFINLSSLFQKNIEASSQSIEITCYAAGPSNDKKIPKIIEQYDLKEVFIIAVPIVLLIILISFIIYEIKKSKNKDKKSQDK